MADLMSASPNGPFSYLGETGVTLSLKATQPVQWCQSTTLHIKLRTFLMHLQCISEALLHTLTHCVSDSACYATLHCPLHLCLCTCCPRLFVCLFVSPSRLFPLIDGQWTSAKSDCTHSIRRGLGRRLRSSLLLNSSPRCDPPCRIVY